MLNIFHEARFYRSLLDGRRARPMLPRCPIAAHRHRRRDFIPFLSNHPDVTIKFIEILCARLRRTSEQVQDVTFLNLPTRLAKTLLQLTEDQDGAGPKRKVTITQREISQIIGRSRESTNKQLRAWAKRGWIKLDRRRRRWRIGRSLTSRRRLGARHVVSVMS